MKTAVIVAAGLGSRLKHRTEFRPKGFLDLEGISLIERSITNLIACGVKKIYIGTGYLSECYEEFAAGYPQIETIKSDKYQTTGSMYTLYNMREQLKEDFLLLESDLLYEIDAIKQLIDDELEDIILSSGETHSKDEVYISVDQNCNLVSMSKNKNKIQPVYGELVGISKISYNRYKMMCHAFEKQSYDTIDYEYVMEETTQEKPFFVKKVEDLVWCEIDNEAHLNRALKQILPKIKAKLCK